MHHPALAERVGDLGEFLRFGRDASRRHPRAGDPHHGRSVNQAYEWVAHARIARKEGLADDVIERVRTRGDLAALPPRYARPARVVQHVLAFESIPQGLQAEVQRELGITASWSWWPWPGQYRLIAGVLFAFDTPLPEGEPAPF